MTRRHIIAGNWKMYKSIPQAVDFIRELAPHIASEEPNVYLAVPFTALAAAAQAANGSSLTIGAQNMNDASEGSFTGEIAARMLLDAGARFVLLGHSERRKVFHESSEFVNRKVHRALREGIEPFVCVGETLEEREANCTREVLTEMITQSLAGLEGTEVKRIVLAYEPVWAIGSGHPATAEQVQQAHRDCREILANQWDEEVAEAVSILYGGSVTARNASTLKEIPGVDGLLVGGASLDPKAFLQIIDYQTLG